MNNEDINEEAGNEDVAPPPVADNVTTNEPQGVDKKEVAMWLGTGFVTIILALIVQMTQLFGLQVGHSLIALGISIVLYGALKSTGDLVLAPTSALGGAIKKLALGGAVVIFIVVFGLLEGWPNRFFSKDTVENSVVKEDHFVDVKFSAPYHRREGDNDPIDKEDLRASQLLPDATFEKLKITPQSDITDFYGEYLIPRNLMKEANSQYKVRLRREVEKSYPGSPSSIPSFELCFKAKSTEFKQVVFECKEGETSCEIEEANADYESCDKQTTHFFNPLKSLIPSAHAQTKQGWVTPALDKLKANHAENKETFVAFKLTTDDLKLPETADRYTYQLYVNETPIYIDGWTEEETVTKLIPSNPFEFEFGLQNLDFSGQYNGDEKILLSLTFYNGSTVLRTDDIERTYTALRAVKPETIATNDISYAWSGKQFFGIKDGYEVFFWSSTDIKELLDSRKITFDNERVEYEGQRVVGVLRSPLPPNENYGLAIGLVDKFGRVNFTFDKDTGQKVYRWIKEDLVDMRAQRNGRSTRIVRPDAYLYRVHKNL